MLMLQQVHIPCLAHPTCTAGRMRVSSSSLIMATTWGSNTEHVCTCAEQIPACFNQPSNRSPGLTHHVNVCVYMLSVYLMVCDV
jgi:hypothetical protein